MMSNMNRPEQADFMVKPMQPVIQKIFEKQKHQPISYYAAEGEYVMPVEVIQDYDVNWTKEKVNDTV